ncbi:DNA-binding transcriptional regulator BolA [Thalassocella blandensis]|nr:DNA-binding transcriptional regulator BolA [Thalassocella blandensis]
MSTVQQIIEQKLSEMLSCDFLQVLNESHGHNVAKGSETHFKVTLVSEGFEGLNRVKRHQKVYATLGEELNNGVHALALHLYTPSEWRSKQEQSPESPQCMGGSKR